MPGPLLRMGDSLLHVCGAIVVVCVLHVAFHPDMDEKATMAAETTGSGEQDAMVLELGLAREGGKLAVQNRVDRIRKVSQPLASGRST